MDSPSHSCILSFPFITIHACRSCHIGYVLFLLVSELCHSAGSRSTRLGRRGALQANKIHTKSWVCDTSSGLVDADNGEPIYLNCWISVGPIDPISIRTKMNSYIHYNPQSVLGWKGICRCCCRRRWWGMDIKQVQACDGVHSFNFGLWLLTLLEEHYVAEGSNCNMMDVRIRGA